MSGITSGVGVFSGIDRNQIISQLLALDARPKTLAQKRITQLQGLSAIYLDINSRLSALKTASGKFSSLKVFDASAATSGNSDVLSATASPGAAQGTYQFIVDRLVSSQQVLSQGFADSTTSGVGLTSLTFESALGRLDRDTKLSILNGGQGVARGKLVVTDSSGGTATVDLSRVESVGEVLQILNNQSGVRISAKVDGDRLVVSDAAGGAGTLTIANAAGFTTASSLGIAGTASAAGSAGKITGTQINTVGSSTSLRTLNDGLGVDINPSGGTLTNPDFTINLQDGTTVSVDIGDIWENVVPSGGGPAVATKTANAVTDLAGVIDRINTQSGGKVTASINAAGTGLKLVDNTTGAGTFSVADAGGHTAATDLGIAGNGGSGIITGRRLISTLNSVLTRNLNGGNGLTDGFFEISARDGSNFSFIANTSGSLDDFIKSVSTATGGKVTLALNASGTGLNLSDNSGGSGTLTVGGTAATELGLTANALSASAVRGSRAQLKYIGLATRVSELNGGQGIGTGQFEITNSFGASRTIDIASDTATVYDLIQEINAGSPGYTARINNNGDGIVIEETPPGGTPGNQKITIRDKSGTVAKSLNLVGTATGTGAANKIDGSYEKTVTFAVGDPLQTVADKINQAGGYASAAVVNDGSPARPFRLALTARAAGESGRFTIDSGSIDLGLTTLSTGQNSRVFFGATDPANGLLFSSAGNSISGVISGVTLNLKSPHAEPVSLTISRDASAVQDAVDGFVAAFNQVITRIDSQSTYDPDTNKRGILLGDSVTGTLRGALLSMVQGPPLSVSGRYQSLTQVGITVGRNGQLQVNEDKLATAINTDPQAVKDLFIAKSQQSTVTSQQVIGPDGNPIPGVTVVGGTSNTPANYTSLGVIERINLLMDQYINPTSGVLTRQSRSLTDQVTAQNSRIRQIDARLESRRSTLERQFIQMESAIGQLQSQQGALSGIRLIS